MHNVEYKVEGTKLILSIDISPKAVSAARPSSTGKTMLLATTNGASSLPDVAGHPASFSLNVMLKKRA